MQPINKLTENALTQIKELSTTEKPTSTPVLVEGTLKAFETFGDPELLRMKADALTFLMELHRGGEPRWLSFVGTSGTGKTFICQLIRQSAPPGMFRHPTFKRAGYKVDWPETIRKLRMESTRDGACADLDEAIQEGLLLIDDIGASKDSEFAASELCRLINRRMNRWTLITSNRNLESIAELIDTRISSRMIRDRNVCVEVNTIDYALRKR